MASLFDSEIMQVRALPPQLYFPKLNCLENNQFLLLQPNRKRPLPQKQCCVSSNLTRSTKTCSCGAIGRHGKLKICFFNVGSSPTGSMNGVQRSLVQRVCFGNRKSQVQILPLRYTPLLQINRGYQIWVFGRTVMHLTFNQVDTGSTPVAPMNFVIIKKEKVKMSENRYAYGTLARSRGAQHWMRSQFPIPPKDEFQSFAQRNIAL